MGLPSDQDVHRTSAASTIAVFQFNSYVSSCDHQRFGLNQIILLKSWNSFLEVREVEVKTIIERINDTLLSIPQRSSRSRTRIIRHFHRNQGFQES